MAKADLPNAESWAIRLGKAVGTAMALRQWSLKELAGKVDRDERQVGRWMSGDENPQFARLFACDALFRDCLLIALAQMVGEGVTVTTQIEIRRVSA